MESLGFKLMDGIRDVGELEITMMGLECAIFRKKIDEAVKNGISKIENSINSKAIVCDVKLQKYSERVENDKKEYLNQISKVKEEYELQFVNSQLELREILENQKKAIARAKRSLDDKRKKNDPWHDKVKNDWISKYYEYDSLVAICEEKIKKCLDEALIEIEKIVNENIQLSLIEKTEKSFEKFLNKIMNIIFGKSKFENELERFEKNIEILSNTANSKVKEIRRNTIEFVCEVATKRENVLNAQII